MKEFERHVTHPQASTSQILDVSNGIYGIFKFSSQKLFFPQHMYSVLDEAKCMIWKEFTRCDSADSEQRSDTLNIFELKPHGIKQTSHNGTKTKFMNTLKIFSLPQKGIL